jgi:hypothetical protein
MILRRPLPVLIALSLLIPGCAKSGKPGVPAATSYNDSKSSLFVEVAKQAGINFTADTGIGGKRLYFIESTPAGGGFVDIDRDGNLDVILLQPGASSVDQLKGPRALTGLFRNQGDGTFTDAIKGSGLDKDLGFAHGVAVADYDNDGYSDILITAYPRNFLFRNLGGSGKFEDVSERVGLAKTHSTGFATSAAFGDIDNDGRLDLYICYYSPWTPETDKPCKNAQGTRDYCTPEIYDADTHRLFRNTPKGFVDITKASGIEVNKGRGLAVAFVDYDQDGKQDIFVANDLSPSFLWHNNGGLKFTDKAVEAGCAYSENGSLMAGMGIAIADYDRTSRPSMFVTNFAGMPNTLFKNIGDGFFENAADTSRIAQAHMKYLSFGCEFLDYDNDGWQDLMTADGHVQLSVDTKQSVGVKQAKRLYRNAGNATFSPIEAPEALGSLAEPVISRGLATADINNDGFVDVLATNQNSPAQLFLNRGSATTNSVSFILRGRKSNADGSHARITLISPNGQKQVDWVKAGSSYLSASDRRVIFGTGDTKGEYSAIIKWPSGIEDKVAKLKPGALYEILEGSGLKSTTPYKVK